MFPVVPLAGSARSVRAESKQWRIGLAEGRRQATGREGMTQCFTMTQQPDRVAVAAGDRSWLAPGGHPRTTAPARKTGPRYSHYEGTSHDVDENKGTENRMLEHPTIFMKTHALYLLSHDVNETTGFIVIL